MLRELRPRWVDLFLLAGIVALWFYLVNSGTRSTQSSWSALWPNVVTDLFFVWVAARLIDGLGAARQRREAVVTGFRSNLNYIARIVSGLLPSLYDFHLRDLGEEMRWLDLRRQRQGKYLKLSDRKAIAEIAAQIPRIRTDAVKARELRQDTAEVRTQLPDEWDRIRRNASTDTTAGMPQWYDLTWMRKLEHEYDRYIRVADSKPGQLLVAITEARHKISLLDIDPYLAERLSSFATAMSVEQQVIEDLKEKVAAYRDAVRNAEIALLERIRD